MSKYMCDRRTLLNHSLTPKIMEASPMSNGPGQAQQWSGSANKHTPPIIFYNSHANHLAVLPACFLPRTWTVRVLRVAIPSKTDTTQAIESHCVLCVRASNMVKYLEANACLERRKKCHVTSWVLLALFPPILIHSLSSSFLSWTGCHRRRPHFQISNAHHTEANKCGKQAPATYQVLSGFACHRHIWRATARQLTTTKQSFFFHKKEHRLYSRQPLGRSCCLLACYRPYAC